VRYLQGACEEAGFGYQMKTEIKKRNVSTLFYCNRKPVELLRFQRVKICINIHFEERKKGGPFLLIVIEIVSFRDLIQSNPEIPNSVTIVL
jgi:hypothetical protein